MKTNDNKTPLVSVIVPNYCHSKYLSQRLDSIVNQTYQNFELIILDDCSPDDGASRCVIEQYRSNSHVSHIVYNEKNSGSTFLQWNKGFCLAQGEYIWIAESDDYCEKTFLEKLVAKITEHIDVAIAYVSSFLVDEEGKAYPQKDISERIAEGFFEGKDFIKQHLCKYCGIWNASAVLFKKDYAMKIDPVYMEFKACGDHRFWIELAEIGNVIHLSEHLNFFRIHTNKVTYNKSREGINHQEELKIFQYLKGRGYIDASLEMEVFKSIVYQLLNNEFNTNQIRHNLQRLWKSENSKMYYIAQTYWFYKRLLSFPGRVNRKIRRLLFA